MKNVLLTSILSLGAGFLTVDFSAGQCLPPPPSRPGFAPPVGASGGGGPSSPRANNPASPGRGGPASPSTPSSPSVPRTPFGPLGNPTSPSHPLAPRPDGLKNPLTVDGHEVIGNPGAWQLWWEFNQDRFLHLRGIQLGGNQTTGLTDWEIGLGKVTHREEGRLSSSNIHKRVVPAINESLVNGRSEVFLKRAMMAMAKIGGKQNAKIIEFHLHFYLKSGQSNLVETAAVALGLAYGPENIDLLRSLAADTEAGRKFIGHGKVPMGTRAFAAYGLGFAGSQSTDVEVRRQVVADLISILEGPSEEPGAKSKAKSRKGKKKKSEESANLVKQSDLQVAAMVSIGLIPLPFEENVHTCYCGTCEVANPESSFQAQVTYLMRYFTADEEFDTMVRAHTASTLGRLVLAGCSHAGEEHLETINQIKMGVTGILATSLISATKQPQAVKNSAIMALGLVGDADNDSVDSWVRGELIRQANKGGPLAKRFALMSLAEVGSRRGQSADNWSATSVVRMELAKHLRSGSKALRPWAGLALGVFGKQLLQQGQELDLGIDSALSRLASSAKKAKDLGAYSLALGLRESEAGTEVLIKKLSSIKDVSAKSYVALGLGLTGNKAAIEELQATIKGADREPLLQNRAGLALGMLGDSTIVEELTLRLQETHNDEKRISLALALGQLGDKRAMEALTGMLLEKQETGISPSRDAAILALGTMSDRTARPWRSVLAQGTNYLAKTRTLLNGSNSGVLNLR